MNAGPQGSQGRLSLDWWPFENMFDCGAQMESSKLWWRGIDFSISAKIGMAATIAILKEPPEIKSFLGRY